MSICNHRQFIGTKDCPLCYPKYNNQEASSVVDTPQISVSLSTTSKKHNKRKVRKC